MNVLALTATASEATLKAVSSERLSVNDPVLVGCSPGRPNIKFRVRPLPSMKGFCESIAKGG